MKINLLNKEINFNNNIHSFIRFISRIPFEKRIEINLLNYDYFKYIKTIISDSIILKKIRNRL